MCFPIFRLNTEIYSVSLLIQSECGKILTRKTANTNTFQVPKCPGIGSATELVSHNVVKWNPFNLLKKISSPYGTKLVNHLPKI